MSLGPAKIPHVYLSRSMKISSAHRLHSPYLSDNENKEIFGPCNNPNGHGHNYEIEVILFGPVEPKTGMVMNLTDLQRYMDSTIKKTMDHKHLDLDVPYFKDKVSTTENIAIYVWTSLKSVLPRSELLYEIKVHETEKNVAFYRGD